MILLNIQDNVRNACEAFNGILPDDAQIASKIVVTASDTLGDLEVKTLVAGWTDTYMIRPVEQDDEHCV